MSEFPDWVEDRIIGLKSLSYHKSVDLHRKIDTVYELIPDIDDRMRMRTQPDPSWPLWKRCFWRCLHTQEALNGR